MKRINQIIFWVLVVVLLTLVFGISYDSFLYSFYFVSLLLPVILGTSSFFNYYLIPHYLLEKRYLRFGIYSIYTIIISMYLEMLVIFLAFILLANMYLKCRITLLYYIPENQKAGAITKMLQNPGLFIKT